MDIKQSDSQEYRLNSIDDMIDNLIIRRMEYSLTPTDVKTNSLQLKMHKGITAHITALTRYKIDLISLS